MDFGVIGERILFVAIVIALVLLLSLIRGRNPRKERIDIVGTLLEETKLNIILAQTFENQPQQRPFHVTGWQLRRKKIDFLDKELAEEINNSYDIALDFNKRLKAAMKAKSNKRETIDIEKLQTSFPRIKQGLEDWLLAKTGTTDHKAKQPGISDWLFGGRS
jgi:hypothetical protein